MTKVYVHKLFTAHGIETEVKDLKDVYEQYDRAVDNVTEKIDNENYSFGVQIMGMISVIVSQINHDLGADETISLLKHVTSALENESTVDRSFSSDEKINCKIIQFKPKK